MINSGCVYVVQAENTNLFKIGRSINIEKRIKELQVSSPFRLKIFRKIDTSNPIKVERMYHIVLKKYRVHGEWFDIPRELLVSTVDKIQVDERLASSIISDAKRDYRRNYNRKYIEYQKGDSYIRRRALAIKRRMENYINARKNNNKNLQLSLVIAMPTGKKDVAFLKRIQRDATAQYYRAPNMDGGYDYIIQSEKVYGEVIDNIEYDFERAIKSARGMNKRQTGTLYKHSKGKVSFYYGDKPAISSVSE